jgi:hypothetical protein
MENSDKPKAHFIYGYGSKTNQNRLQDAKLKTKNRKRRKATKKAKRRNR